MHKLQLDSKLDITTLIAMEVFKVAYGQVTNDMKWETRRLLFAATIRCDRGALDSLNDPTIKLSN